MRKTCAKATEHVTQYVLAQKKKYTELFRQKEYAKLIKKFSNLRSLQLVAADVEELQEAVEEI